MARILIAEDDATSKDLLQKTLEEWSYDIVATSDGSEALAKIANESFDLLVTDWMMPEPNGVELCRTLKANDSTRDLPVVMLTTKKGDLDFNEAYTAGVVDFVTKPFNRDDLGPTGWESEVVPIDLAPREQKNIRIAMKLPADTHCRRQPVGLDLVVGDRPFGHVAEALVTVGHPRF